ncbi:mRNA triphosphatase CET1 [Glomus cerebriforme]|uniref:mRNA-capping enzyme subunit beta n=1 Tax=Glomus cerebriforme TaxID=658196 RepID=A0A397TGR6_9GLOM|nr:mRNA triphosphatase CET1 [Glomus cerebriforme]
MSKRRRVEDNEKESGNEESTNGLVQRQSPEIQLLPAALEHSIFGVQPTNDFVRVVSDFLYMQVGKENVEIEAKLGVLLDKKTRERIRLPVYCETVISPYDDRWMIFESNMTLEQHKSFNNLLNNRFIETKSPSHKGQPVEYKHTYEIDKFYDTKDGRIRVTRDRKTGEIVEGGIVQKVRIADLNIYSPNTKLDYRISVNAEIPKKMPEGPHSFERNKDRLSYTHQIVKVDLTQVKVTDGGSQDLTHELEVEFIDPRILLEEKLKIENRQENRYVEIVEHFLNNIRMLAKNAI